MALISIHNEEGSIMFDGEYGNIVIINGRWEDGAVPRQFNVSEYCKHYGVSSLPKGIDIRDIGYRREDGVYQPPCGEFRNAKATEFRQGERS